MTFVVGKHIRIIKLREVSLYETRWVGFEEIKKSTILQRRNKSKDNKTKSMLCKEICTNVHTSERIDNSVYRWSKTMFGYVILPAIILMLFLRISVGFVGAFVVGIVVFLLWLI